MVSDEAIALLGCQEFPGCLWAVGAVFGLVGIKKKEAPKWRFELASFLEIPTSVNSQFGFYEVTCWVWLRWV